MRQYREIVVRLDGISEWVASNSDEEGSRGPELRSGRQLGESETELVRVWEEETYQ
jgi:hypothetical protein